jgi:hypothetical protein
VAFGEALARDLVAHLGVHQGTHRLVEITLVTLKPDKFDDFCLGRQFLGHFLLGPAQHEWLEPPGQERLGFGIAVPLDWDAQGAAERRFVAEQTGTCLQLTPTGQLQ